MNKQSQENKDCVHAEVDCVSKLKKSEKCIPLNLVVFRTNNNGDKLMMSKPCQNCLNTIDFTLKRKNYNLKKIWYTDDIGKIVLLK